MRLWPTPQARDGKGANQDELIDWGNARPLNEVAVMWSTPRASDREKGGPNQSFGAGGVPLAAQTVMWMTPDVPNGGRVLPKGVSTTGMTPDGRKMQVGLENQAKLWTTACADDTSTRSANYAQGGEATSKQAADPSSRLDPTTYDVGGASSPPRRSLNPLFVEWLMGWPAGWTLLGWTDFGCSETALSRWWRDMRSALSQLALHDAPQAQPDLFGG